MRLEGPHCRKLESESCAPSVQVQIAAGRQIYQGEKAAIVDGSGCAHVPRGCRGGRVVAQAQVQILECVC